MLPRRPVNTDTMDDVLKMQNDYLKEKEEGKLKPAAQAISLSGNKGNLINLLFHIFNLNTFRNKTPVNFRSAKKFEEEFARIVIQ